MLVFLCSKKKKIDIFRRVMWSTCAYIGSAPEYRWVLDLDTLSWTHCYWEVTIFTVYSFQDMYILIKYFRLRWFFIVMRHILLYEKNDFYNPSEITVEPSPRIQTYNLNRDGAHVFSMYRICFLIKPANQMTPNGD